MRKATALVSLILCLSPSTLPGRSLSQTRGPQSREEFERRVEEQRLKMKQQQEEFRRDAEQQRLENERKQKAAQQAGRAIYDEYSDEAWQEALGATAEQWQAIKPRLEQVKKIEGTPVIHLSVYAFGGGGSTTSSSFSDSSGGAGAAGTGGGFASGSAGGFGGAGGSAGGGSGIRYSGRASGNARAGGSVSGGASGGSGGSFASGGAASSGGGYGFSIGGTGPVKKQVGEVCLGWQWRRPSLNKSPDQLSGNEKTCERLLDVLETKDPDPEQVRRHVEALRKIREQIQSERQEARRQLREVVTPAQEAKLILMGYLD